LKAAFLDLLAAMLEEAQGASDNTGPALPEAVRAAVMFIELHYHDPNITLDDIAGAAHLSPDHFGRVFHSAVGHSPIQHLRRVRIERSCFLLRNTALRIEDISREVGVQDPFYFSRIFRKTMGTTPREYRNQPE
jgi:AraC-like DNA-binding protein